jgi:hypothetical protein
MLEHPAGRHAVSDYDKFLGHVWLDPCISERQYRGPSAGSRAAAPQAYLRASLKLFNFDSVIWHGFQDMAPSIWTEAA